MSAALSISPAVARKALWKRAALDYLRHSGQAELTRSYRLCSAKRFVVNCARRWGKSRWACTVAIEEALRKPGSQILYATATQKDARDIVEPHMLDILDDCPIELRPVFNAQRLVWTFKNGSRIEVRGLDGVNANRRRGGTSDLIIVDEAGFVDDLEYITESVLLPRTLTTGGRLVMISTPSKTPAHPFRRYCLNAKAQGAYELRTIYDAPESHLSRAEIERAIEEAGGPESSTARREYLCEFVTEDDDAVIPEFQKNRDRLVCEHETPPYRHLYVAADFGFSDMTVVVFAYFDFINSRIVVEDELAFQGVSGVEVGNAIRAKEIELWGEWANPLRIADAPQQLLADVATVCGVAFTPATKTDADAALNSLRMDCQRGTLAIHPRCTTVIGHMENAIWNTARTSFARSEGLGHFDGVDAMKYLCRHVDRHANPYPEHYGIDPNIHDVPPNWNQTRKMYDAVVGVRVR